MKGDRAFGLISLIGALAYVVSATRISGGFLVDPLGPRFFPLIIGSVAGLCGLLIMLRPDEEPSWPTRALFIKLLVSLAVLFFYALTLRPAGFLIPTAIASALLSYQIRPNVLTSVLTGLGLSIGLFVIFRFALGLGIFAFPRSWTG